jgi:hypothetical protein
MKKITLLLITLIAFKATAQTPLFVNQHPDSVVRIDHRMSQMMYEPGEVLVRFHDDVSIHVYKANGMAQTGISSLDAILMNHSVTEAEKLIKDAAPLNLFSSEMILINLVKKNSIIFVGFPFFCRILQRF